MKEILDAMHTEAMHGYCSAVEHHKQQFFNGRATVLTELLQLLHHDDQVRAYTTAEIHCITQEEESNEAVA
tara:strand:+ start:213 stop:425 length:213 start_codon:yes stop_codon:yes gene_type:complete